MLALGLAVVGTAALAAYAAEAAIPQELWKAPEAEAIGGGAGELDHPAGIAADPVSGHIYVADYFNARISEFDAWGVFVKAWGWGVRDGSSEPQTCGPGATPPSETCLKGIAGSGPGQFGGGSPTSGPRGGLALDSSGAVYVGDMENFRVQKFEPDGSFVWMVGGEVNQDTSANLCTAASGDTCGAGVSGEGDLEFTGGNGVYMASGPAGTVFVGAKGGRLQELEADGTLKGKVTLEGELGGAAVRALAIDGTGSFYATAAGNNGQIFKFNPAGESTATIAVAMAPEGPLATDSDDNLYAVVRGGTSPNLIAEVVQFDSSGEVMIGPGEGFAAQPKLVISGLTTNVVTAAGEDNLYLGVTDPSTRSFAAAYGPPPDLWPPPPNPPTISDQFAISANPEAAQVRAKINPRFWSDTTYQVQYGTGKCSEGGCESIQPLAGELLTEQITRAVLTTKAVALPDLAPATTYHFRFIAQSGGGGPVYGLAPEGGEASESEGLEGTFTTPAVPLAPPDPDPCPNAALRSGPSAFLADCRAYEMVSPVDKQGGEIFTLLNTLNERASLNQAALGGERLTYSSYRAFEDPKSAPATSQYLASRVAGAGWASEAISPVRGTPHLEVQATIESQFRAFDESLCEAWLWHDTDPPLSPQGVEGFPNLYETDLCDGADAYEALTRSQPPGQVAKTYFPQLQGVSEDATHSAFRANGKLAVSSGPAAASGTKYQCYDFSDGDLRLVSVLPNGNASTAACSIGTAYGSRDFRNGSMQNAISADGSRIFWTASEFGAGKIYVRIDGANPTVAVSTGGEALSGEAAQSRYWTANRDGSRVLYSVGNLEAGAAELYEFEVDSEETTPIAGEVRGMMGADEEAQRVYLVSEEALEGAAVAGEPNLYLWEGGEGGGFTFIAELSDQDAEAEPYFASSPVAVEANRRTARISSDGLHAAFMSTAPLTGFDNTDAASGQPDSEVFRYDAAAGQLSCVSCNPTGIRPSGRNIGRAIENPLWAAAQIPGWTTQLHPSRVLSADGSRLYFESFEALVPRDTNNRQDLYQWEEPGSGDCSATSPAYSPPNDGCLSLISSGTSPQDSAFVDASADGRDVFFATSSSLVPQDPGLVDVYDARAGGGFPPPPPPPAPCQGGACQSPAPAPQAPTPSSSVYQGPANPPPKQFKNKGGKRKCAKGKHKAKRGGKVRCVKNKKRAKLHSRKGGGR